MELCKSEEGGFSWEDYTVLGLVLAVTSAIGAYYSYAGKKASAADFLVGGGTMATFPTALSLATGFITAIELLGNPAEMYNFGSQFWMTCVSFILVVPITSYLYLPVYMKLRLTSAYEYLEMRFNKPTRYLASTLYVFQMVLYTSVAVYAPALALSHVTSLNVYAAVSIVYVICIFYASQGGMKAVIMTDTFQTIVLILSLLAVMFIGNSFSGGFGEIFRANEASGRIEIFNMNPDPTVRHTFWSVVVGGTFYWATMFCSNQATIQKYMSVKTINQARRALWTSCFGLILIFSINFYTGMIMYSVYKDCDPLLSKEILAPDELLPFYVVKAQGFLKGIPGLFVAGIFAASLGTVAAAVNSLAAVSIEDLIGGLMKIKIPESKGAVISKWLSVFFGLISFGLIFIVEQLGSVLQVALSFNGITGGVTLGLFSLGMFFPWANTKGALTGSLIAFITVCWIGIGTQVAIAAGFDPAVHMPTSINGCLCNLTIEETAGDGFQPMVVYKLSYLWYSALGFLITTVVGGAVSLLTSPQDPCRLHPDLISPPIASLLRSLPNRIKEKIGIPIETKDAPAKETKVTDSKCGVINPGLTLDA